VIDVWPPGATTGPLVKLTNPDKVLYPATAGARAITKAEATTKAEVFRYYTTIADVMLPHITGRPATRKRWPNGVDEAAFFEKELARSAPAWLSRGTLEHRSGAAVYPIIDTATALAWIAQQGALEVHVPQWCFTAEGKPGPANRLVFDLDPGDGVSMAQLCEVALAVRELMNDIGLRLYPLTSGSKGMHLYAALAEPISSTGAALLARRVAQQLEQSMPDLVTATMTRSLRAGKVFLDWSQNNAAKTTIAPYSLRGRAVPTVAAPRTWDEIGGGAIEQLRYDEVLARAAEHGDLLAGLDAAPSRRSAPAAGPALPATTRRKRGAAVTAEPSATPDSRLHEFAPMLATLGSVDNLTARTHAFEGKFDGYRLMVEADHGRLRLATRNGHDVTAEYPQLRPLGAELADHHVILDGEVVALDEHGVPQFEEMQNRARAARIEFWAFDILELDGQSLLRVKYRDRRRLLETFAAGTTLVVPDLLEGDGAQALAYSRRRKWEGVVAKKWDSTYQPGRRSASWIKDKNWNTQEAVIGGWRKGEGGRSSGIGALLLGIPVADGLRFIGRVGTGFTEKELGKLKGILAPLHTTQSPFDPALPRPETVGVTYVRPELVGEVRYGEMTSDGRLRHASWRGLRPDRDAADVKLEAPGV
jgi:bifunctional non-homologous end joining protein LigD